jgi:hypothetical protein
MFDPHISAAPEMPVVLARKESSRMAVAKASNDTVIRLLKAYARQGIRRQKAIALIAASLSLDKTEVMEVADLQAPEEANDANDA